MANKDAKNAQKQKKTNFFVATFSELKQVSWPTFGDTMKRLGAVLVITVLLLIVLIGIDLLLGFIHEHLFEIVSGANEILNGYQIASLIMGGALVIIAIAGVIAYKVVKIRSKKD